VQKPLGDAVGGGGRKWQVRRSSAGRAAPIAKARSAARLHVLAGTVAGRGLRVAQPVSVLPGLEVAGILADRPGLGRRRLRPELVRVGPN
jgi:hypothetical protein